MRHSASISQGDQLTKLLLTFLRKKSVYIFLAATLPKPPQIPYFVMLPLEFGGILETHKHTNSSPLKPQ